MASSKQDPTVLHLATWQAGKLRSWNMRRRNPKPRRLMPVARLRKVDLKTTKPRKGKQ
jgi:hypothetical protein